MDEFDVKRIALEAAASLRPVNTEALISAAKEIEKFLRGDIAAPISQKKNAIRVIELTQAGFTRRAIAKELGISPVYVTAIRRRAGITKSSKIPPEEIARRSAFMNQRHAAARRAAASTP